MTPFHDQAAIAIDGGGIRGLIVARALEKLEKHLDKPLQQTFRLTAGTSTGSIIAAGIAAGLSGETMTSLYLDRDPHIFHKGWRARLWPLTRYRYPLEPLEAALKDQFGDKKMGDFWSADPPSDVIITVFGLKDQRTHFVKP
jgi:patatin-like phospholipase/acyl hydrolase